MTTIDQPKQGNRRRAKRSPVRSNVKVQCRKGGLGLGPNLVKQVLDVSDTGTRILISKELDLKSEVEVTIEGYGLRGIIKRLGNIRWQVKLESGDYCIGVEFQKCLNHRDWCNLVIPN